MPATKLAARQDVEVAQCDFTYVDITSGTYAAMVDLPLGAIVVGGYLAVTTLFNSATTDVFSIGDKIGAAAATATTYAATSADVTVTGRAAAIVPTGIKMGEAATVGVVWTGAGAAPTTGVGKLVVEYMVADRAESSFET